MREIQPHAEIPNVVALRDDDDRNARRGPERDQYEIAPAFGATLDEEIHRAERHRRQSWPDQNEKLGVQHRSPVESEVEFPGIPRQAEDLGDAARVLSVPR